MEYSSDKTVEAFTDLRVWQSGHELVLQVYKQLKALPAEEKYNLIDQLRRAALSITNNIAEGYSRQSTKEKLQFYYISLGSLKEVQNCLIVCKDLQYISPKTYESLTDLTAKTGQIKQ